VFPASNGGHEYPRAGLPIGLTPANRGIAAVEKGFQGSDPANQLSALQLAASDLRRLATGLQSGLGSVPNVTLQTVASSPTSSADSVDALGTCLASQTGYLVIPPAVCGTAVSAVESRARDLGTHLNAVVGYGSRSSAEVAQLLTP
jgi:hypothetical protein